APYDAVDPADGKPYIHPETVPYLDAFETFVIQSGIKPTAIEMPLYSPELDICCTPDFTTNAAVYDIQHTDKPSRTWGLPRACEGAGDEARTRPTSVWLRLNRKERTSEVHSTDHGWDRISTPMDFDVVREACAGIEGPAIKAWKKLEGR